MGNLILWAKHVTRGMLDEKNFSSRNLLIFLVPIVLASCGGHAQTTLSTVMTEQTIEHWRCFGDLDYRLSLLDGHFPEEKVAIRLSRVTGEDQGTGEVSVAGIIYQAYFRVVGIDLRWDFGEGGKYTVVVGPDGSGAYYDFSRVEDGGATMPSQHFNCISH